MATKLDLHPIRKRSDIGEFSVAVVAGLALAFTLLFIFAVPIAGNLAAARDFVSYWATGHQLVQHGNPYDRDAIAALEHSAGLDPRAILIMRNPPWALPLVLPLGYLSLRVGSILWTLLLFGCLLLSVHLVHQLHGSPPNRSHWLGFAFAPSLICFSMGQTSLFALMGLLWFLRLHLRRPFAAGVALWLCALKPHLFLPFGAALALWVVVSGSYKVIAGLAAALAISGTIASIIDPRAWHDYLGMIRSPAVENDFIPCFAVAARHWLHIQATWPQYLPVGLCCIWALVYFWRRRANWNWITNSSPLMLVSLLFAPYCWFYDQCLAMPAMVHGAYDSRSRHFISVLALVILAADIQLCIVQIISPLWLWTAPAWFALYLFARATTSNEIAVPADASI